MKKMKVCVVEYETTDGTLWKAGILAFNIEDAVRYVYTLVPTTKKIISTQTFREIDAIEPKVQDAYFTKIEETVIRQEAKPAPKPQTTQEIFDEPVDGPVICDLCNREFKNAKGLELHKRKMHK